MHNVQVGEAKMWITDPIRGSVGLYVATYV